MRARVLILAVAMTAVLVAPSPAYAAGRVTIDNGSGAAVIDATYATTLTVSGTGFQSVQNGHGGIYVFFGTVRGTWRPSQGGQTGNGQDGYYYVPDSESADNQGFQRYVAFPGSDTGAAANGGQISADGTWSTQLTVPGAVFRAADRTGAVTEIDCRVEQCGIITVGAHGVANATNESFTPVTVGDLYGGRPPAEAQAATEAAAAEAPEAATAPAAAVAALTVDRSAAVPGRILTFTAVGLVPGDLVVATLDDGLAAAGPIAVGTNGQVAGALKLPPDLEPGTHTLRLSGEDGLSVSFAVRPPEDADETPWVAIAAAAAAGLVLLLAVVLSALWIRSVRRKAVA